MVSAGAAVQVAIIDRITSLKQVINLAMTNSDIAIRVENLSKRYRIGLKEEVHDTFAGMLADYIRRPVHNLRRLRRLTSFSENGRDPEDIIWALKDVSFEVKRGEVVGIIGRNGAGKSTLLKILSRITHPTSGRFDLCGRVSSLLEVGTGFHPELTGRENIYLNGTILGMRKAEIDRKFDEIVDFSGVERFIDTPVKRYSTGMRVRLAFSVAAYLEPEILLIDEVLAVGDVEFQKKCLGKMEDVAKGGRTVLFVSHSMAAIQSLCPISILLGDGQVIYYGDTGETVHAYLQNNIKVVNTFLDLGPYRHAAARSPILESLRTRNVDGYQCSMFEIGHPIYLDFTLYSDTTIPNPHLAVAVNSIFGVRIFTVSTRFTNTPLKSFSGRKHVRVVLKDVNLAPGEYRLKVTFGDSMTDIDILDGVPAFEIMASDYWGTGKLPKMKQGVIIQNVNWEEDIPSNVPSTS